MADGVITNSISPVLLVSITRLSLFTAYMIFLLVSVVSCIFLLSSMVVTRLVTSPVFFSNFHEFICLTGRVSLAKSLVNGQGSDA